MNQLIERLTGWLKENKAASTFALAAVVVAAAMFAASGCSFAKLIKHDVPSSFVALNRGEDRVSLADSDRLWERWQLGVEQDSAAYAEDRERAEVVFQILGSLTNLGIQAIKSGAPAFPGGVALVGMLGSFAALYTNRPGTATKNAVRDRSHIDEMRREKEASHADGRKVGKGEKA